MIEKSILLPCSPEKAFQIFTERASEWWPPSHRPSKQENGEIRMEPMGRFYERAADGREFELGRIRVWEPPRRIVLDFYLGTGPANPTEADITFAPEQDGTRIQVNHRAKAESEEIWPLRAPVYERSWDAVLGTLLALPL